MDVAFITPTKNLAQYAVASKYHLVLAHQYLADEMYRYFYQARVKAGDTVILDNSAYELSGSIDLDQLVKCAESLRPSAVILPDVRFKAEKTLRATRLGIKEFKKRGWPIKLLAVPQGKDLESVLVCYLQLAGMQIDGFGIYEEIGKVTDCGQREDFLAFLERTGLVLRSKYYHLLGMEENLHLLRELRKFSWVGGIDSAKPIVYGMNGLRIHEGEPCPEYPHRPSNYFERDVSEYDTSIRHNQRIVQSWVKN